MEDGRGSGEGGLGSSRRLLRLIQAKNLSTTQRRGWTAKPTWSARLPDDLDGDRGRLGGPSPA